MFSICPQSPRSDLPFILWKSDVTAVGIAKFALHGKNVKRLKLTRGCLRMFSVKDEFSFTHSTKMMLRWFVTLLLNVYIKRE